MQLRPLQARTPADNQRPVSSRGLVFNAARAALFAAIVGEALCRSALAQETSAPIQAASPRDLVPEIVSIAVPGAGSFGSEIAMRTEVYKPSGDGPFPVLIFSHGRAADRIERAQLEHPILKGHVGYWLHKGFAVVAPIRVGYGPTGGPDREYSGGKFDSFGTCTTKPDFRAVADAAAQATLAALDWVRAQPWADKNRMVLEGQSAGGFATVATVARQPQGVIAYINFAGGSGGLPERAPGHSCDPEQMRDVMAELGKTTTIPGIWLYARNDLYWGPDVPRQWFDAFVSGGDHAEFVDAGELPGHDGHKLLTYGRKMWSVPVDRFLKQFGL
jgi:dienelactone hydrolase